MSSRVEVRDMSVGREGVCFGLRDLGLRARETYWKSSVIHARGKAIETRREWSWKWLMGCCREVSDGSPVRGDLQDP
jgi:hypothetical protein